MTSATGLRLVVVDDEPAVRTALCHVLADSGFEILGTGADGLEAVDLVRLHRPDVVLLDVRMPKLDGVEAARRIREMDGGVRIVVFSAQGDAAFGRSAVAAGADAFLLKGCALPDLVEALNASPAT